MSNARIAPAYIIAAMSFLLSGCGGGGSSPSFVPAASDAAPVPSSSDGVSIDRRHPRPHPRPTAKGSPTPTNSPVTFRATAPPATPTPTLSQGATPTPAPTLGSTQVSSSLLSWVNGQAIPASFASIDFGASGPLFQQLPANPQLDPNSDNAMAYYFAGDSAEFEAGWVDAGPAQAQYDYNFPVYTASTSDPLVTIVCNHLSPAPCNDGGTQIHVPALATQAGGTDHHLAILESDGTEYDFWLVSTNPPYSNGSTLSAAGEAHYALNGATVGSNTVAPGFDVGSATAGGVALSIGQIYTLELAAGVINHAIALLFPCSTNAWVYPASQTTGTCANGEGMPLGSRVWWMPDDVQTQSMSGVSRDMKTVLVALHHYGGFFTDNGAGDSNINGAGIGTGAHIENQEPYWVYGNGVDPALNYARSASGWVHVTTNQGVDHYLLTVAGSTVDFLHNLKVVAPCVTQRSC